jgi:hypothetical protein
MKYEQHQVARLREELRVAVNKVPQGIQNGSVQATRAWLERRNGALKVLKKPNATETELRSALSSIQQ